MGKYGVSDTTGESLVTFSKLQESGGNVWILILWLSSIMHLSMLSDLQTAPYKYIGTEKLKEMILIRLF